MVGAKEELGVKTSPCVSLISAVEGLDKSYYPRP